MYKKRSELVKIYTDCAVFDTSISYLILEMAGIIKCSRNGTVYQLNYPRKRTYKGNLKNILRTYKEFN